MKLGMALVALVLATGSAFAATTKAQQQPDGQVKPVTAREIARMTHLQQQPIVIACMADFKFDFFSNQLGLSIDGRQNSEEDQLKQFRLFLNTGKLEQIDPKAKISRDLTRHCAIVAQTVAEVLILNRSSQQQQSSDDSGEGNDNKPTYYEN